MGCDGVSKTISGCLMDLFRDPTESWVMHCTRLVYESNECLCRLRSSMKIWVIQ